MKLGAINQKLIAFGLKLTKKNVKKIIYMCTTFEKWEAYIEETKIEESDNVIENSQIKLGVISQAVTSNFMERCKPVNLNP